MYHKQSKPFLYIYCIILSADRRVEAIYHLFHLCLVFWSQGAVESFALLPRIPDGKVLPLGQDQVLNGFHSQFPNGPSEMVYTRLNRVVLVWHYIRIVKDN